VWLSDETKTLARQDRDRIMNPAYEAVLRRPQRRRKHAQLVLFRSGFAFFLAGDLPGIPVPHRITRRPLRLRSDACCGASRRHIFFIAL
jgi:hypothetical protein